jgi:ankyrin repeat protein
MVFQSFNLLSRQTAITNVELPLRYSGNPDGRRERAIEALKALVEAGAKVNAKDKMGRTPLHTIVTTEGNARLIETLVKLGEDPNATDDDGNTPLHLAVERREHYDTEDKIRAFVKNGGDINKLNKQKETPLDMVNVGFDPLTARFRIFLQGLGARSGIACRWR